VTGFAGLSATRFCSFCRLLKSQISDFNVPTWERWTRKQHVTAAERWKEAPTEKERDVEFSENGIRWSELLRLPYWDPLKCTVVDAMHNLFLNDLQHHCRDIWGMDSSVTPHKTMKPHFPDKQTQELSKVFKAVSGLHRTELSKVRITYIAAFVRENSVHVPTSKPGKKPTKKEYIEALIAWVCSCCLGFLFIAHHGTAKG
jgi:hypothetical protein